MTAGVPLSVMSARVARRRPIMRVAKPGLGLRRGLYAGLLGLRLQVLWRQIDSSSGDKRHNKSCEKYQTLSNG